MLSKFFNHGSGGGSGPIDYLLGENRDRDGAEVLRGDPDRMESLINSLNQKHNYTSGALSFSEHISDKEKQLAMDKYEEFLSGKGEVQLDVLWVEHTDKDRTELHFIVANTDLDSQRSYTPYVDKIDRNTRDALDNYLNTQISDFDPDDPAHKRRHASSADYIKSSKEMKAFLEEVEKGIEMQSHMTVAAGGTWTRKETLEAIKEYGLEIKTEADKTITVKHEHLPPRGKRLKGELYERSVELNGESEEAKRTASERYAERTEERARENLRDYESRIESRSERIRDRYEHSQSDSQRQKHSDKQVDVAIHSLTQSANSARDLSRELHSVGSGINPAEVPREAADRAADRATQESGSDVQRQSNPNEKQDNNISKGMDTGLRQANQTGTESLSNSVNRDYKLYEAKDIKEADDRNASIREIQRIKAENPILLPKRQNHDRARKDADRAIEQANEINARLEQQSRFIAESTKRESTIERRFEQQTGTFERTRHEFSQSCSTLKQSLKSNIVTRQYKERLNQITEQRDSRKSQKQEDRDYQREVDVCSM